MKTAIFRSVFWISLIFAAEPVARSADSPPSKAQPSNSVLAIYLATNTPPFDLLLKGALGPKDLQLAQSPVLKDADFLAFDRKTGVFTLTPQATYTLMTNLLGPQAPLKSKDGFELEGLPNKPFVITALGVPVVCGMFTSRYSSVEYDTPTIRPNQETLNLKSNGGVRFKLLHEPRLGAATIKLDKIPELKEALAKLRL